MHFNIINVNTLLFLQEWVPVIARDARRQSREPAQPPFSDAYLHGMPAKRRKVGTQVFSSSIYYEDYRPCFKRQ